jgi:DNA helicase-2/ATP-dependent DNA helicase PcrA
LIRFNDPDRLEVKNKINKKLISARAQAGQPAKEITCQTLSEETDFVANEIEKLVAKKQANYKDIAILVRANSQADPFLRALNFKGIPFKFIGNSGLYSQSEVSVLVAFLNSIANFDDSLSLYQLSTSEIYQLPLKDCISLMDYSKRSNRPLSYAFNNLAKLEGVEISKEAKTIVERIKIDLAESLEQTRKENVGQVLYQFLQKTKYLERLERDGSVEAETKIQNIAKFFEKIREFIDLVQNE